jgi:hypothetical protein
MSADRGPEIPPEVQAFIREIAEAMVRLSDDPDVPAADLFSEEFKNEIAKSRGMKEATPELQEEWRNTILRLNKRFEEKANNSEQDLDSSSVRSRTRE